MATDGPRTPRRERRAPQPLVYSAGQLLGRRRIWLRRRSDRWRLAAHVVVAVALIALTLWWVLPQHAFAGPVLVIFAPGRGVHLGDLPSLAFLAIALRSTLRAGALARGARAV